MQNSNLIANNASANHNSSISQVNYEISSSQNLTSFSISQNTSVGEGLGKMLRKLDANTGHFGKKIGNGISYSANKTINKVSEVTTKIYNAIGNRFKRSEPFDEKPEISLPEKFQDVRFQEFNTGNRTIKTSVFRCGNDTILRTAYDDQVYTHTLPTLAPGTTIKNIGVAMNETDILVSYPVESGPEIIAEISKFNLETGENLSSNNNITIGDIDECLRSKPTHCNTRNSGSLVNSHAQKSDHCYYGITKKLGALAHYQDNDRSFSILTLELEGEGGGRPIYTTQVMLDSNGAVTAMGETYFGSDPAQHQFLKNADYTTVIKGNDGNRNTQSIFSTHYDCYELGLQLRFTKSLVGHSSSNPNILLDIYGACFSDTTQSGGCDNNSRSFRLTKPGDIVQAHHMRNIGRDKVLFAWSVNNIISGYALSSKTAQHQLSNYDDRCKKVKKELFPIKYSQNVTNVHISPILGGGNSAYIAVSDSKNNLHCQEITIDDVNYHNKDYGCWPEVLVAKNFTVIAGVKPELFSRHSTEYLCNLPTTNAEVVTSREITEFSTISEAAKITTENGLMSTPKVTSHKTTESLPTTTSEGTRITTEEDLLSTTAQVVTSQKITKLTTFPTTTQENKEITSTQTTVPEATPTTAKNVPGPQELKISGKTTNLPSTKAVTTEKGIVSTATPDITSTQQTIISENASKANGLKIGVGVSIGLVSLLAIGVGIIFHLRACKRSQSRSISNSLNGTCEEFLSSPSSANSSEFELNNITATVTPSGQTYSVSN